VGEIADALKRSRTERERQEADPQPLGPEPSTHAPPGRADLLAALREPAAEAQDAPSSLPSPPSPSGSHPRSTTSLLRDEGPLQELDEASLASFGKAELHRQLALQVATQLEQRGSRTLAVLSALRDEGKTTVACTIAMALASVTAQRSVALVDLDLRNPSVARRLGIATTVGVESFLNGRARLEDVRASIRDPQLDVFPSVDPQRSAHELLARPQLAEMIRQLEARYQTVIIDTPPTLIVPDSSLILKSVSSCITVARAGVSRVRRFQEMLEILPTEAIVGKVLNCAAIPNRDAGYYDYTYGPEE
jgi:Mrp family chromosome partitioning ATPase